MRSVRLTFLWMTFPTTEPGEFSAVSCSQTHKSQKGQNQVINTLDLTYPTERGPYNYNPAANGTNTLPDPAGNFGGITRSLNSTNFEQGNVEYIQFWMLDPFVDENLTPRNSTM
jgi:cell surface protein SprA